MNCCGPSRRQALLWAGLAATAGALVTGGTTETEAAGAATTAGPATAAGGELLVRDLEVVTVTDTSVVITWFTGSPTAQDAFGFPEPVAADTELQLGTVDPTTLTVVPGSLKTVFHDAAATAYHYAEVTGLEPGRLYGYVALSDGQQAQPTSMQFPVGVGGSLDFPGTFTTLTTPPGKYLFTLALSNDLHFGEADSGIIEDNWPPSFTQDPGASYQTCTVVPSAPDHHDCWGDVFPYRLQQLQHYDVGGLRLVGLDTTMLDAAGGTMNRAQLGELTSLLSRDRDQPTLLFGHHPVTYESAATTEAGPSFDIDRPTAVALQRLYARTLGVFFHHSGHTHRNKRTFLLDSGQNPIPSVEFLEVGATKEYPRGYSLLRLFTGGYMVSYYKNRTPLALAWSQRTRGEYYSLYPHYMLGTIADRNHTVVRDLSGLRPLS